MKLYVLLLAVALTGCNKEKSLTQPVAAPAKATMPRPVVAGVTEPALPDSEEFTKSSAPFALNGRKYYWQIKVKIYDKTEGGTGVLELVDVTTHKTLLMPEDYYKFSGDMNNIEMRSFFELINRDAADANFDGYQDLVIHNYEGSGTGGDVSNIFLYNPQSKTFSLSTKLSGGNVEIDAKKKTLTNSWRFGGRESFATIFHFNNKGKVAYTEGISYEKLDTGLTKRVTTKTVGAKVVETKTDTIEQ